MHIYIYICIHIYIYMSLFHAISTDIPDPLSPRLLIVHSFQQILRAASPYQHRAVVCRFGLDVLPLLVPVIGSIGVHLL